MSTTGQAYYGDPTNGSLTVSDFGKYSGASGAVASTLAHPLATHVRSPNLIRKPFLLYKNQYSTDSVSGGLAFKRRFTDASTDSFALVTISGGATFSNILNRTYIDVITGDTKRSPMLA